MDNSSRSSRNSEQDPGSHPLRGVHRIVVISFGRSRGRSVLDKADIRAENRGSMEITDGIRQKQS